VDKPVEVASALAKEAIAKLLSEEWSPKEPSAYEERGIERI
jgi:hypothetical protein